MALRLDEQSFESWYKSHSEGTLIDRESTLSERQDVSWLDDLPENEEVAQDVICSTGRAECLSNKVTTTDENERAWARLFQGENGRLFIEYGTAEINWPGKQVYEGAAMFFAVSFAMLITCGVGYMVLSDLNADIATTIAIVALASGFGSGMIARHYHDPDPELQHTDDRSVELIEDTDVGHSDTLRTLLRYRLYREALRYARQHPEYSLLYNNGEHCYYFERKQNNMVSPYLYTKPRSFGVKNYVRTAMDIDRIKETIQEKHSESAYRQVFSDSLKYA